MARNLLIIIVFNEKLLKLLFYNVELYVNVELCGAATSNSQRKGKRLFFNGLIVEFKHHLTSLGKEEPVEK